jgi:membrane protease YdiL (CAAX protease family)
MNKSAAIESQPQHPLGKSFLLHITPGVLTTAGLLVFKPLTDSIGYPPLLAFLVAIVMIDIPLMIVVMLNEGRKVNGRFSFEGVVLYREKVSWRTFAWVFIVAFLILYFLIMLSGPIDSLISERAFSWMPKWIFFDDATQYKGFTRNTLVIVFTLQILITGITLPWVEELYFRGYLLPRISRFEKWAPLIGAFFFSLYHVWQLYGIVGIFLLGAGLGYVVWWKKDVRLSIGLHVFANTLVRVFILANILVM